MQDMVVKYSVLWEEYYFSYFYELVLSERLRSCPLLVGARHKALNHSTDSACAKLAAPNQPPDRD